MYSCGSRDHIVASFIIILWIYSLISFLWWHIYLLLYINTLIDVTCQIERLWSNDFATYKRGVVWFDFILLVICHYFRLKSILLSRQSAKISLNLLLYDLLAIALHHLRGWINPCSCGFQMCALKNNWSRETSTRINSNTRSNSIMSLCWSLPLQGWASRLHSFVYSIKIARSKAIGLRGLAFLLIVLVSRDWVAKTASECLSSMNNSLHYWRSLFAWRCAC